MIFRRSESRPTARRAAAVLWVVLVSLAACESAPTGLPPADALDLAAPWVVADPSDVGMDANRLFAAGQAAEASDRAQSLLVIRQGRLVYERYFNGMARDSLADTRSVTKSVVATLVGIAIESGAISDIDDPITDYLDGARFRTRPEHDEVTVRHLLQMSSGIEWAETNGPDYNVWLQSADHENSVLDRAITEPGSTFTYNSGAAHLLGVVVEEAVGRPLADFADEAFFGPLGIREVRWEALGGPYVNAGSGIDIRPRDLARLGQLYLQGGFSGGRSVVPQAWIDEVTLAHRDGLGSYGPVDRLGYGYLWWHDLSRGAYMAWGWGGQFIYVVPSEELVVVTTTRWTGLDSSGVRALTTTILDVITGSVLGALP